MWNVTGKSWKHSCTHFAIHGKQFCDDLTFLLCMLGTWLIHSLILQGPGIEYHIALPSKVHMYTLMISYSSNV